MSVLDAKHFSDEAAAYRWVEARVWPHGPACPRCGGMDRIGKLKGKSTRPGVYKCYACRKPFTVKVGTVFESSHLPLHKWLQAAFLMCASKKGISANQLARILDVDIKTGWFVGHRLREAMNEDGVIGPLGGAGMVVEVDETYIGPKDKSEDKQAHRRKGKPGAGGKVRIMTLLERGGRRRRERRGV